MNLAACNFLLHLFLLYTWYPTLRLKIQFLIEVNRVCAVVGVFFFCENDLFNDSISIGTSKLCFEPVVEVAEARMEARFSLSSVCYVSIVLLLLSFHRFVFRSSLFQTLVRESAL